MLKIANSYGDVIVGLMTDSAISQYKTIPNLDYKSREMLVKSVKSVYKVVPENEVDYYKNLKSLKPDYLVHSNDWLFDHRITIRKK